MDLKPLWHGREWQEAEKGNFTRGEDRERKRGLSFSLSCHEPSLIFILRSSSRPLTRIFLNPDGTALFLTMPRPLNVGFCILSTFNSWIYITFVGHLLNTG